MLSAFDSHSQITVRFRPSERVRDQTLYMTNMMATLGPDTRLPVCKVSQPGACPACEGSDAICKQPQLARTTRPGWIPDRLAS